MNWLHKTLTFELDKANNRFANAEGCHG